MEKAFIIRGDFKDKLRLIKVASSIAKKALNIHEDVTITEIYPRPNGGYVVVVELPKVSMESLDAEVPKALTPEL